MSSSAVVAGDHCHRPGCQGIIMPTPPTGQLFCSYCHSHSFEQRQLLHRSSPIFAGEKCHRFGCAGSLRWQLVCSDCHSGIVEQFISKRSPPPPPPTSLPLSVATRLSNVLDQQPQPAGHGRILNLNLDLDEAVEGIRKLQENNPDLGKNIIPVPAAVQELADVEVNEEISESDCVICRARFGNGDGLMMEQVKRLPCGHLYHMGCLLTWFNLCRQFDRVMVCRVPLCRFRFRSSSSFSSGSGSIKFGSIPSGSCSGSNSGFRA